MEGLLDGRYRLEAEIARGAIGTVRRATDMLSGEPVAVKVLRPEAAREPQLVAAFIAEAEILAELDHPSIVRVRDFVAQDGQHALVMDLVDGEDLRHRVRRDGPVPPAVAANVVAQVADALAYLHGRGIVHGDVKPGNLLVPADGGPVRLADFGVARRLSGGTEQATHATPEYVSPEVVSGGTPSPAADVYALGIVLFELLCGRSPFRGGAPTQVLSRHGQCAPVPPPGLPPVVWPVIEACLSPAPEDRPEARFLAARLRGVEPALDGVPALPPLSPEQVTWWPRPAGATTATVPVGRAVSWVPLRAAPVSPASAYGGRMVAIPVASLSGDSDASNGGPTVVDLGTPGMPAPVSPAPATPALVPPASLHPAPPAPPHPVSLHPVPPASLYPVPVSPAGADPATMLATEIRVGSARLAEALAEAGETTDSIRSVGGGPRRPSRPFLATAAGAAGVAAAAVVAGIVMLGGPAGDQEPAGRPAVISASAAPGAPSASAEPAEPPAPVTPEPRPTPSATTGPEGPAGTGDSPGIISAEDVPRIPGADPSGNPPATGGTRTTGPDIVEPEFPGLPGIGDTMPTMPPLPRR
ncbi:MAG TPA: protein kinase, partial [Pilimelia sp.]|nr:protein kinase [Pilimelia sp.]